MEEISDNLLINYIKNSFDIIVKNLLEEKANIYNEERDNTRQEYETVLIKYEADIREHIKIEHQMKLYIDSLESEKEELKYKNHLKKLKIEQLSQKISNLKNNTIDDQSTIILREETSSSHDSKSDNESVSQLGKFRKFEEEIIELKKELDKYKEQNKNLSNNIKKINEQYNKELNEAKDIKNKYKKEIKLLKKQLLISESKLKHITEINTNNITNNNSKNSQPKKNIFKTQSNNSIHVSNDISMHRIPSNNKKIDLSVLLNKTTTLRKNQSSLSATSSIDKIEKYLKRKFSTLRAQKTHKMPQSIKIKKKDKNNNNNSITSKKKAEDLMKLFLNDSSHLNLTDRIKGSRLIQKSDDNSAYYNKYCNKNKIKNKKRTILQESNSSIMIKKARANIAKKSFKNNLFEMINNINNIDIFPNNAKQAHYNMYYKSNNNNNNNSNCSFNNGYEYDMMRQYNNSAYNINSKKKEKKLNNFL